VEPINEVLEGGIMAIGGEIGTDGPGEAQGEPAYSKVSGKVEAIDVWDGQPYIRIMEPEGGETDFVVEEGMTVFSDLDGLSKFDSVKIGSEADVYFIKPLFMTLQYPPRFTASVVVVRPEGNPGSAFVGAVDKDGRASDGSITLNISDETIITRQSDGKKADASSIRNKIVIAYFAITTRSLPPIALVQKVIVLDNLGIPVFVNGVRLFDAAAVVNGDGVILAPLRAVTEALGYDVSWDDATNTARVGVAIYVKIGSDEYTVGRAMPMKLDAAAELIGWRTYVPLSFFTSICQMELDEGGLINLSGKAAE
jgi:hypothetical protein